MFRIKLVLIGLGGFLAFIGFKEYRVSKGTTAEPVTLELAAIEAGTADLSNAHMQIGEYYPVWYELIYYGEEDSNKVDYAYYPVLSSSHPFIVKLAELYEKYPEGIPDGEVPEIKEFSMLIKTKKFKTTSDIPTGFDMESGLQGLVINKINSLKKDELGLLQESFPSFDEKEILVLEEGREPAGMGKQFAMMGGGSVLLLIGLIWLIAGARKS